MNCLKWLTRWFQCCILNVYRESIKFTSSFTSDIAFCISYGFQLLYAHHQFCYVARYALSVLDWMTRTLDITKKICSTMISFLKNFARRANWPWNQHLINIFSRVWPSDVTEFFTNFNKFLFLFCFIYLPLWSDCLL